ncbi:unnamed protein product [Rhizophagus irregularis]|nr:unnamed protein product [Rhizophagus irregularis]CAB5381929.1 unnamed protein product [Rhizophagus irregularis]
MSTQSTSNFALKAFYVDTAIENWTCARIMECYRSKSEQKDRKKVLDRIKKDLEEVEESDSFDTRKKRKAREILDNWKNWTDTQKIMKRSSDVNIGRLQVKKMKNFASGSATQVVDNNTVYRMENVVKMLMSPMMTSCPLVNQSGKIYHYQRIKNRLTLRRLKQVINHTEQDGRDNKNLDFSTRSESTLECDDDDNSRIMSAYDYEKYKKSYAEMNNSNKWVLTTGTVVEDALYNFGLRCKYEHLAHSFILDPDDNNYLIESVFTESELHEIRHYQTKETPLMPLELLKYLNSFNLKNTLELRKQIFMPEQMDQDFNRSRDFDRDWIRNTVYNLLLEYESNALMSDHLELWILVHVWNFTDKVFNDIEEVKVVRGESCSLSSSTRKNHKRTVPAVDKKRKILGRRGDMIIRKITDEYGCAEAGRQFEGQNGTKLLQERGLKMPKMMKDMFDQLCKTFDQDEKKTRKLETIGFLHADSPAGYICRVSRSKSFFIATHIKEFGKKTLPAIALTWKAKKIVDNMICLVGQPDESDEESQLQHLQDIYDVTPQPSQKRRVNLPTCLNTPSKSSKRVKPIPLDLLGPPPPFNLLSTINGMNHLIAPMSTYADFSLENRYHW